MSNVNHQPDRVRNSRPGAARRLAAGVSWAAALGALCGVVIAGLGSRVVMKFIALANPETEGVLTDSRATVGDFTLGGTLGLVVFGGVVGVLGGLVYLGIRRWLLVPPKWHGLAFSIVSLVTVGTLLFDPSNADFQIFEPAILVIFLFSSLFFANGLLLARLMDRLNPEPEYTPRLWGSRIAVSILGLVVAAGAMAFLGGAVGMIQDQGTCLAAAGGGNGCAVPAD